jgi:hypothetical protein
LVTHFSDIVESLKNLKIRINPNNINALFKKYEDFEIAIALKVKKSQVSKFRDTVHALMHAKQLSTNCYCHAVNDSGPFPPFMKPWPGMISGLKPSDGKQYKADILTRCVEADGGIPIGLEPQQRDGYYQIYLFLRKDGKELHFLRENSNGEYSHKTALGPVTNLDDSGHVITDPLTADMGDFELAQIFLIPAGGLKIGVPPQSRPERPKELDTLFAPDV